MKNGDGTVSGSLEEFIYQADTAALIMRDEIVTERFLTAHPYVRPGKDLTGGYHIIYVPVNDIDKVAADTVSFVQNVYPMVLGLLDTQALEAAGIAAVQRQPYLDLRGNGVLIGFIDTGIDYTSPAFCYEDNTTKIRAIWDQTIPGAPPGGFLYGSEYSAEQINAALQSETPFGVVPHRDTVGHGTFLASVACGREEGDYAGAAPDAEIIAVKLRQARPFDYYRNLVPAWQKNAYSSDDFIMGVQYVVDKALALEKPVAICISVGTNSGSHNGQSTLAEFLGSTTAAIPGVSICAAAGNESAAGHHTMGKLAASGQTQDIELRVGTMENILVLLWNYSLDRLSFSVTSPTGEKVNRVPAVSGTSYKRKLVLEKATVIIEYVFPVQTGGEQVTRIKLLSATPGTWVITVHGDIILDGTWHAWLPLTGQISPDNVFIEPVPEYTIVTPASSMGITTCGAYDSHNNMLYPPSSWGPTRMPSTAPDLMAPGVGIAGSYPGGQRGSMSGTSVAAAVVAGASALLLEWSIVKGNDISVDSFRTRAMLVAGCDRSADIAYPNNQWGYGRLNLYNTFKIMRPI